MRLGQVRKTPGKVAAILYYQTDSGGSVVDRDAIETYLHNKYGL